MRIGFLYPGHAAEDDYPLLGDRLGFEPIVVHTTVGEDAHRADALADLGGEERLAEGAALLREERPRAAMWACTSGSFVFGWEGARRQVSRLADRLGVPVSSTPFAFVEALGALGARRVAVAATYPDDVAALFGTFLERGGVETVAVGSRGILTAAEVGTLGMEEVVRLAEQHDHPAAEALLLPDTALHTAAWLEELEEAVGKPVLTANQVTAWEGLRLAGETRRAEGLGTLFRA